MHTSIPSHTYKQMTTPQFCHLHVESVGCGLKASFSCFVPRALVLEVALEVSGAGSGKKTCYFKQGLQKCIFTRCYNRSTESN